VKVLVFLVGLVAALAVRAEIAWMPGVGLWTRDAIPPGRCGVIVGDVCVLDMQRDFLAGVGVSGIASGYDEMYGVQTAILESKADRAYGLQLAAGHAEAARGLYGAQVSFVNFAYGGGGLQVGLYNKACDGAGALQIGVVNQLADNAKGVQIGLVNFVGEFVFPVLGFRF